jgi:hypothetical protein
MPSIAAICLALGDTPSSIALRESVWTYPLVESVHVLALCLFAGFAVLLDLRLLGWAMRRTPVSEVATRLLPWTIGGFGVMVVSGSALFFSDPMRFYGNVFFRVKVAMLLLAGLNAFIFHATIWRRVTEWDRATRTPPGARIAGLCSLLLWTGIVTSGRMIAYNWFN